jgi:cellulose synthase/poly-beta-1,6-N-acetylglucosamine synthase-like glycosyltransferase
MIVAALCICAAAPVALLALECLLGTKRLGSPMAPAPENRSGFTVLMPAHDEARGIAVSIDAVMPQLGDADTLLVVADNCSDDTALVARAMGAEVIERFDPTLRGKGYALEFGRAHLRGKPGDVVIILDADCLAEPDALPRIAATARAKDVVVQGAYLLAPRADASTKVRISSFAFLIKNLVRQRALGRLAGAALLQGSGMAFPRRIFDRVEWKADSLVEDLDMGVDLLLAGERVVFEDSATFYSDASSDAGTESQRRRWEHGMLSSMARHVPALLGRALRGKPRLAWVALDLMVPPTVMLLAGSLLILALAAAIAGLVWPVLMLSAALLLLGLSLARAWAAEGRNILPWRSIAQIPAYIFWKLPIAAQFFVRRERQWIRTEREP